MWLFWHFFVSLYKFCEVSFLVRHFNFLTKLNMKYVKMKILGNAYKNIGFVLVTCHLFSLSTHWSHFIHGVWIKICEFGPSILVCKYTKDIWSKFFAKSMNVASNLANRHFNSIYQYFGGNHSTLLQAYNTYSNRLACLN